MISSPWSILLCKFNDDDSEPYDRTFYDDLFTASGIGKLGMVDFFRDMSHGTLDLTGSRTFGWFTIGKSLGDYIKYYNKVATPEHPDAGGRALVDWAREAAAIYHPDWPKVDLSKYFGVVVVYNVKVYPPQVPYGGWIDGPVAVIDGPNMRPSAIGQEMCHGYGISHSRSDLSPKEIKYDYNDPWDIMSTEGFPYMQACHAVYGPRSIGPGLNAANMDGRNWLDKSRIWNSTHEGYTEVELRPLHRRDLPGFLGATIDTFFVEFRMDEGWDAAIGRPVILLHYFEENYSYIQYPTLNSKGDKFEIKDYLKIEVLDIDVSQRKARISIDYSLLKPHVLYGIWPWEYRSPAIPVGVLGPEDVTIISNKIRQNPEWSFRPILKLLSDISTSEHFDNETLKRTIRRDALEKIISIVNQKLNHMDIPGGVASPPVNQTNNNTKIEENKDEGLP
jgi:hypothetical protein